jgi:predicted RNA methylase
MPRQQEAATKREELRARLEQCKNRETRAEVIRPLLTIPNFFPTPAPLVSRALSLADLRPGLRVLEPSCGKGDLALPLAASGCAVECVERVHALAEVSRAAGLSVRCADFLAISPNDFPHLFDRVVMNPPFERGSARLHVLHAWEFVADGGDLVAIVDSTTANRLAEWCDYNEPLPSGSFEASERPTSVNTALIQKTKKKYP